MIAFPRYAFLPAAPPAPRRQLLAALEILERWAERRQERRALLGLSDHSLKDIGLSAADAWQEGHKSFWQS